MERRKFTPKPGQVDYTDIRYCPVVNTVVVRNGKVLLVKRSEDMRLYPGFWNGISGFLDDSKDIADKVRHELSEEIGIADKDIKSIKTGKPLLQDAPEYKKTWLVVPVLAEILTEVFKLDWEAQEARWFSKEEIQSLELLPGFDEVINQFLNSF